MLNLPSRRLLLAALASLTSLAACGGGGTSDTSAPADAASDLVQRAHYPGAVSALITTTSIHTAVAGAGRPQQALRDSDWLPVGSLSKSFTASLAGLLVQEGRLRWDTRMLDLLPELRSAALPAYAQVTLRELLAHRAGIFPAVTPEQLAELPEVSGSLPQQRLQLAAWALARPPSAAPGQALLYSNGGYVIAAAMLERAAGAPYETLLQSRLLGPLGIEARFGAAGAASDEVQGHVAAGQGWSALAASAPEARFPAVANPAGGLKLTAAGIARFLQMHLRGLRGVGGEPLSPDTIRSLHQTVQADQALGWVAGTDLKNRPLSFHAGSDEASYYALAVVSRGADEAAFVVVNGYRASTEADVSRAAVELLR